MERNTHFVFLCFFRSAFWSISVVSQHSHFGSLWLLLCLFLVILHYSFCTLCVSLQSMHLTNDKHISELDICFCFPGRYCYLAKRITYFDRKVYPFFVQKHSYSTLGDIAGAWTIRMSLRLGNYVSLNVRMMPSTLPYFLEHKWAVPGAAWCFNELAESCGIWGRNNEYSLSFKGTPMWLTKVVWKRSARYRDVCMTLQLQ